MDEIMQDTLLDDIRNYFAMWPDGICQSCKDSEVANFCQTCDARFLLRQAQKALDITLDTPPAP